MVDKINTTEESYITNEISSNVFVNYGNRMKGEVDVSNTPRRKYYGNLVKDTYTSKESPEDNFLGVDEQRLNNKTTLFLEWHFDSVDDEYFESEYEVRSGISLYMTRALRKSATGYIYKVNEQWSEYLITENKAPETELLGQFELPKNTTGWFNVDLGDYLADYKKENNIFSESLAIVIDSEESAYTYSRESGEDDLVPELWYEYYFVPPNSAIRIMPSVLNLREDNYDKFNTLINVDSNYDRTKTSAIIDIDKINDTDSFKSKLTTMSRDIPNFLSQVNIEKIENTDEATIITFVGKDNEDLFDSKIDIPDFDRSKTIEGKLKVYYNNNNNINSIIDIPNFDRQETINANTTIYYDDEDSINSIIKIDDIAIEEILNSNISVYKRKEKEFNSIMNIPINDKEVIFNSDINIYKRKDSNMNSIINIDKYESSKTFGAKSFILELNKAIFNNEIEVPKFEGSAEFLSKTTVHHIKTSKLNSTIKLEKNINESNINADIEVMQHDGTAMKSIIRIKTGKNKGYSFIM